MTLRGFLFGFIVGLITIPVAAWIYIETGSAPVRTSASPLPLERYIARIALHRKIASGAPARAPAQPSTAQLADSAKEYQQHCEMCHGLPAERSHMAKAMYPNPPALLSGKGVTDDPVEDTYWVVKNGVRLSGMPAFDQILSDDDIWRISYLLKNAHNLPAAVQTELQPRGQAAAALR